MKVDKSTQDAYIKSMKYCSRYECCSFDIIEKIRRWGFGNIDSEGIVKKLAKENFIDDKRYLQNYVLSCIKFKKWGFLKIRYILLNKGFKSDEIQKAFGADERKLYNSMIENELAKKIKELILDDKTKAKVKIYRFAQSRGFELDKVKEIINKLLK